MTNSSNESDHRGRFCEFDKNMIVIASLVDVITLIMGQPVIIKLLLITFNSKKPDILNFNLALFHNVQYLISICHLIALLMNSKHGKIARFLLAYVQIGGPMGLCFICMERYVAVIHPTFYPSLKTYRCRELCALTVWFLSVPLASMTILSSGSPLSPSGVLWRYIPQSVMVLLVMMMVYCSARVARALTKCGPGKDEMHPVKKRALRTVLATSIITMCCYLPVTILQNIVSSLEGLNNCLFISIHLLCLSSASVVHPMFYLYTQGQLSAYLKALYSPCGALM